MLPAEACIPFYSQEKERLEKIRQKEEARKKKEEEKAEKEKQKKEEKVF